MSVLVLHHSLDVASRPEKQKYCAESNAGVLAEVEAVTGSLDKLRIPWTVKSISRLTDLRPALSQSPEPVVFNLVEELVGHPQDASVVPAILRALGKGYTGSPSFALMLSLDKWRAKAVLSSVGLPTPPAFYVPVGQKLPKKLARGTYIVKPSCADASEGIDSANVVHSTSRRMASLVRRIHKDFNQAAIVERYIDGREFNVSVLQYPDGPRALPVAEIDFSAFPPAMPRIIDYAAKWDEHSFVYNNTPRIIPAKLPAALTKEIRRLSVEAWHAIGCRGYARIDFRLDKRNKPWIIEVNTNPDLSPECGLTAAIEAAGLTFADFVRMMYDLASREISTPAAAPAPKSRKAATPPLLIERASAADRQAALALIEQTKFFRPNEVVIAAEVFDDANTQGPQGDYQSFIARNNGSLVGWVCYGETPCTLGTFDIYWLAVDPRSQGLGIGRKLMDFAEKAIKDMGGRIAIVETSGSERYIPTRAFYEKVGYKEASRVEDFYAPGDPKIIYTKVL